MPKAPPEVVTAQALWLDSWQLGWDIAEVVWLRSCRLVSGGPQARRESHRMVTEKIAACMMFWPAMARGGLPLSPEAFGARALAHYAEPVRRNQRRLRGT
ncbi:hypothetical protein GRI40_12675 [Altererythrobacter aerius]|uniref:Uncharacterized protein n=1 Tax=Tsuneonella aeria TaxID=1837929 RepID=A0A6I4TJ52_9SPHN|nr:hypothetical protein [Tsuneonella aeria]MXO76070.1 hypothetical protein [Tsuneonella aeria]